MNSYIYGCLHTYINTYMHEDRPTYIHTYIQTCVCLSTFMHTYLHTNTHAHTHVCLSTYVQVFLKIYIISDFQFSGYQECPYFWNFYVFTFSEFLEFQKSWKYRHQEIPEILEMLNSEITYIFFRQTMYVCMFVCIHICMHINIFVIRDT